MGGLTLGQLLAAIAGSGLLAFFGVIMSGRTGRQRDFDQRVDKRLADSEAENKELDEENSKLRIENTRLQTLLWSRGIDPASPARVHDDQGAT